MFGPGTFEVPGTFKTALYKNIILKKGVVAE